MKKIDLSIYKEEWEIPLSSFFLPKKHIRRDFSERRILMEREKETFLYEEREQKLKDQQMYMNLMREHPEEVREIYIEDPTIPSPDSSYKAGKMQEQKESDSMDDIKVSYIDPPDFVQKKDNLNESDSFYNTTSSFNESYIRNSREMDAQKEWNEKMQERKDYSINNQDKEEIISPVKELLEEQDSQHKTEIDNVMKGKNSQKESNSVPSSASSSFNESNLRNSREIDAQKEWEQKMKERSQTDKEEKEEPVFQTEDLIEKRDEMQEKEIDNALKMSLTNVMRYQTNSMSKILASQKNTIKNGKDFLWRTSGAQTDTGRGIKETEANVLPFVQMAVDTTKRTLAASIAGNMHTDKELQKAYECLKARTGETNTLFSVDTTKALTTEDIKKLQKGLRKYLRDNNIGTFSNKPEIMQLELNRAIKSGRMQDAIANRINRQTPAKSMSVLQKEDGVKENDIQKEETPHVNINNFLKKYDIQGRKFGDSVFLQNGNDNSTITPADCMNPAKLQQAIGTVYGNNLDTSIKAALISAACSLTGEEEKDIHHKIPTKRGTIDIEIKQLEKHFASISINGKNVIEKIPKDILKNPKAFRIVDGKGSLTDHIEQKIEEELSKTHTLSKDLTVSIGKDHTLSVWDKEKEIYKGPAEIKAFENIFTEHPLEEISAKTAAVALYCTLKPEEFAKEYQQKSIFDNFSYPDGTAYISVKQDGISLHEPKLSIIDRDMGKLIQKSSQSCTVKEIMAELGLSKDEAKEVKNLQGDETVVVMSEGVPTFATATDEGEIYLYQPEQMPEILTKRAIEPYLEDHKDLLPVLVEKEGKIQTAYIEENGEISYLPAFSDLGYHMEASDTISLLTPDCITPEYFYEFTQELSSLYQLADEKGQDMPVKVSFAKEPESFTYVKEGSGKQPEKVDPNNLPFPEITKDAQEEKKEEKKENASILEEGIVQVEDRDEEEYDDDLPFSDMPEQTYSDIPPFSDIDDIER